MYPFLRMAYQMFKSRGADPLPPLGVHVSEHICWPHDIDLWMELNNGRTLTLFDLGRIPLAHRTGLIGIMRQQGWGLAIAGASVRYRRRVKMFNRVRMRSQLKGWDERFLYIEQSMWHADGTCANHIVLRGAVTGPDGIVPPARLMEVAGEAPVSPALPGWIDAWSKADGERPWPPDGPDDQV